MTGRLRAASSCQSNEAGQTDYPAYWSSTTTVTRQSIEQEIEGLKTKLLLKDTRAEFLATQLKDTQRELEETQTYIAHFLVGSVAAFAMPSSPKGWLECNGQAVSRTTYARLFHRIGTQFGEGDGSTTFNLPDLRGVFVRGWDNNAHRDPKRSFGSYQTDQMQSHTHQDSGHSHGGSVSSAGSHSHSGRSDTDGSHSHDGSTNKDGAHYHGIWPTNAVFITTDTGDEVDWKKNHIIVNFNLLQHDENENVYYWRTKSNGDHTHSFSTNSAGDHSHSLTIDSAGSHSHDLSISTSQASLGSPTASGAGSVRHGSETRPKNVALLFCIKY